MADDCQTVIVVQESDNVVVTREPAAQVVITAQPVAVQVAPAVIPVVNVTPVAPQVIEVSRILGEKGDPGTNGGSYVHSQGVPAPTWTVVHNLGYYPNVRVEDSAGDDLEGDIGYTGLNSLTVTFSFAVGGIAYLS